MPADKLLSAALRGRDGQVVLEQLLEPLIRHDLREGSSPLLSTLEAFVDCGLSIGATARKLRVHRHTVEYRLKAIERLLGRSPRHGLDKLLVALAVAARSQL